MKNVLQLVLGHAELLRRRIPDDPRLRAGVDQIIAAAERGARSSEAIQDYARSCQVPPQVMRFTGVVREAMERLTPRLPPGVRAELRLEEPGPLVLADRRALRQVVLHLGSRAAHAMPSGGVIDVSLTTESAHPGGPRAVLAIRDSGTPMTAAEIAQVRHPFDNPSPDDLSYKVGLALADRILRDTGGSLELVGGRDTGTIARCILPVSTKPS
jgi:signal transduction histidine kinase